MLPLLDLDGLVVRPVALQALGGGGLAPNEALLALENQHGAVREVEKEPEERGKGKKVLGKNAFESRTVLYP